MKVVTYFGEKDEMKDEAGWLRYDQQLSGLFPDRTLFLVDKDKDLMIAYVRSNPQAIVITQSEFCGHVPKETPCIIVYRTASSDLSSAENYFEEQKKFLSKRPVPNTLILSCSTFCYETLQNLIYEFDLQHCNKIIIDSSQWPSPTENCAKLLDSCRKDSKLASIAGNWTSQSKENVTISALQQQENNFSFISLLDQSDSETKRFENFDIYLQLHEKGEFSYDALDAMQCGVCVVATNSGIFYRDVPKCCFVELETSLCSDTSYVSRKLAYAFSNRKEIANNAQNWLRWNNSFDSWKEKTKLTIQNFSNKVATAENESTSSSDNFRVHLFLPFYKPKSADRQLEILQCLQKNVECKFMQRIYLCVEPGYDRTFIVESEKIEIVEQTEEKRQTFADIFSLANSKALEFGQKNKIVAVVANCDVYFDKSLKNLSALSDEDFVALSRWDPIQSSGRLKLHPKAYWSQDSWIFRPPCRIPSETIDFGFGMPGCDNRIAFLARQHGYSVSNPCKTIVMVHLHEEKGRAYTEADRIDGEYLFIAPCDIDEIGKYEKHAKPFNPRRKQYILNLHQ